MPRPRLAPFVLLMSFACDEGPTAASTPAPAATPPPTEQEALDATRPEPAPPTTALAEPASAPVATHESPPATWRLTTLVAEGPDTMMGARGHYLLELAGATATLTRVGANGRRAEARPEASAPWPGWSEPEPTDSEDPERWPGVRTATLAFELPGQPMRFELWHWGDAIAGIWAYTGESHVTIIDAANDIVEEHTRGGVAGSRGESGPFVQLPDTNALICPVCCAVEFHCGPQGPGTCNSSMVCLDGCIGNGEVPRIGCAPPDDDSDGR